MLEIIKNIDDYVWEIKLILNLYQTSPLFYKTIYEGISAYITTINVFAKEIGSDEADNALEKLYTLQQFIDIKIKESEERQNEKNTN